MNSNYANRSVYNCLLIDDDKTALHLLENCLSNLPEMNCITSFSDAAAAINEFESLLPVDFLFLDIKMPLSGIEVARLLRSRVKHLIFTTAYPEYALDAFSVEADHYLIKPLSLEKLNRAIASILDREKRIEQRKAPE